MFQYDWCHTDRNTHTLHAVPWEGNDTELGDASLCGLVCSLLGEWVCASSGRHCRTCTKLLAARQDTQRKKVKKVVKVPRKEKKVVPKLPLKTVTPEGQATQLIEYLSERLERARDVIGILHASIERYDLQAYKATSFYRINFSAERELALDFIYPVEKTPTKGTLPVKLGKNELDGGPDRLRFLR